MEFTQKYNLDLINNGNYNTFRLMVLPFCPPKIKPISGSCQRTEQLSKIEPLSVEPLAGMYCTSYITIHIYNFDIIELVSPFTIAILHSYIDSTRDPLSSLTTCPVSDVTFDHPRAVPAVPPGMNCIKIGLPGKSILSKRKGLLR